MTIYHFKAWFILMWQITYKANTKNQILIHKLIIEFIISTSLAYLTSIIWNSIFYFCFLQFQDDSEFTLFPTIERWIIWNSLFFVIFLTYAKLISKPLIKKGSRRYRINSILEQSLIIPFMDVAIMAQFFVFFTPKGFYLYLLIPIHFIILWILNKA